jgi:cellobiose-specific phosphotransferase system component IIB
MREWSKTIGASTNIMVESIISAAQHNEIACRRSHGFLNLSKKYGELELEAACSHALANGISNYQYIEIIIKQKLATELEKPLSVIPMHDNIRGSEQYH